MEPDRLKIALELENIELKKTIELMRQLSYGSGFYKYFFENIDKHKNRQECFNAVNELYYELFGEYKFSDYSSFRASVSKYKFHKY